jgi:peroxiredoxin (alkyl hydroperoxide reductase subunit C)
MAGRAEGVQCEDWFFCTKEIPADEVEAAIRVGK